MDNSQTKQGNENEGQKKPLNLVGTSKTGDSQSGAATATAKSFYDQAKETAGQAYEAVSEKAAGKLDEQRSTLSDGLSAVADSVRQVSTNLGSSQTESSLAEAAAKYTDSAARKIENVAGYQRNRNGYAGEGLKGLQATARERRNVFASLMEAVKTHSLGQISHALYDVGGEYRRNM